MKKIFLFCTCLFIGVCAIFKPKLNTPLDVTTTAIHYLSLHESLNYNCYEDFKNLFDDSSKDFVTIELYDDLTNAFFSNNSTGSIQYTTQIVKFENGEVYVVVFHAYPKHGEFKISNFYKLSDFIEEFDLKQENQ